MKRIYLLTWLILACATARAQGPAQVVGTVRSVTDTITLSGITIRALGSVYGSVSDTSGRYLLRMPAGKWTLRVEDAGEYLPLDMSVTLRPHDRDTLNVFLRPTPCHDVNSQAAEQDLRDGKVKLWLNCGDMGGPNLSRSDTVFQRKYQVQYVWLGMLPTHCIVEYNGIVFRYLDSKFGKVWRTQVRSEVVRAIRNEVPGGKLGRIPPLQRFGIHTNMRKFGYDRGALSETKIDELGKKLLDDNSGHIHLTSSSVRLQRTFRDSIWWGGDFQQTYNGLVVEGSDFGFTATYDGNVVNCGVRIFPDISLSMTPLIDSSEAFRIAKKANDSRAEMKYNEPSFRLVIFPIPELSHYRYFLAWKVRLGTMGDTLYYIDATNGSVLEKISELQTN